jgi:hypothetical protein
MRIVPAAYSAILGTIHGFRFRSGVCKTSNFETPILRICGELLQFLTGESGVGFSKRSREAALKAVAVKTQRADEIVRQEAPSARRRMIAQASAILRGRPGHFPFALAYRRRVKERLVYQRRVRRSYAGILQPATH